MTGTLILVVYLLGLPVGFVVGCRWGYWDAVRDVNDDRVEGMVLGVLVGLLAAAFWPLVLTVGLARNVLFEPRDVRRQRELDERERRIEQLEREVGIRR